MQIVLFVAVATLSACSSSAPLPDATVVGSNIELVSGPSESFDDLLVLETAERVTLIGRLDSCDWLQVITEDGQKGWVAAESLVLQPDFLCSDLPPGTYRPETHVLEQDYGSRGVGELVIDNGSLQDGVAVLATLDELPVAMAYIRDGESVELTGIPDGTYYIFFSAGREWDGSTFTESASYQRFDDTFAYHTTDLSYSTWSVTLHPVAGGNASARAVDPEQFPGLGN